MSAAPVGLQQLADDAAVSAPAAAISRRILAAEDTVSRACELVAEHFLASGEVEMVVVALTVTPPDDRGPWMRLGDRVWLREWLVPGSPCLSAPGGEGPEGALTMPYVSLCARDGIVAVPDRDALPPEGERDRWELEQCATAALVTCALQRGDLMYGSISLARSTAGVWSQQLLADYRLVVSTLAARMADQHAQLMLTDALSVGDQARAVQQQFFATVGHELRTPVSTIIGYAELLQEEAEAQPAGDFAAGVAQDAGHVLTAAEHLLAVVEDLLGTGQVLGDEASRVPVDVAAAVADVLHWLRVPADRARVTMTSTVEPGLAVLARPAGVRQVLTNLVGNAVGYNRPGGRVEVGAQPLVGEGGQPRVRVTVRDTGVGLDAEQLKRVFEPFVRFADPTVRGTGLGLPLARTVAERDGGSIGAESTPGQGSVFWLDLPVG